VRLLNREALPSYHPPFADRMVEGGRRPGQGTVEGLGQGECLFGSLFVLPSLIKRLSVFAHSIRNSKRIGYYFMSPGSYDLVRVGLGLRPRRQPKHPEEDPPSAAAIISLLYEDRRSAFR